MRCRAAHQAWVVAVAATAVALAPAAPRARRWRRAPAASTGSDAADVWAPARWTLRLDFGREPGTSMPRAWAASGARLALPVDVEAGAARAADARELGGGASRLAAVGAASFVGADGLRAVAVGDGGWTLRGDALRGWIDLGDAVERNDVRVPAARLYLTAAVWRGGDARADAAAALAPLRAATACAQAALEAALDHASGDRRLDGADALETARAYADTAALVAARDAALRRQRTAEADLPSGRPEDAGDFGPWPGAREPVAFARGAIAVRRRALLGDAFDVVGAWRAAPRAPP